MSRKTQWALTALVFVNIAVLLPVFIPAMQFGGILIGLILGGGAAHALHGSFGCDWFPESERG